MIPAPSLGALVLIRRYADRGDPESQLALGQCAWNVGDIPTATEWFQRSASSGNPMAATYLAQVARRSGDLPEAMRHLEAGLSAGLSAATYEEAMCTRECHGDSEHVWALVAQAAENGNELAMLDCAVVADERGDRHSARDWLRRAMDGGSPEAARLLARIVEREGNADAARVLARRADMLDNVRRVEPAALTMLETPRVTV